MRKIFLIGIRFYQKYLAFGNVCRFQPTCSEYSYQAIERYGIIRGSYLAFKRIIRCHPWAKGGKNPLPV